MGILDGLRRGSKWAPFTNGELLELHRSLELGQSMRIFTGNYEGELEIQRAVVEELKRRGAFPPRISHGCSVWFGRRSGRINFDLRP